jgi:hypothetical protein
MSPRPKRLWRTSLKTTHKSFENAEDDEQVTRQRALCLMYAGDILEQQGLVLDGEVQAGGKDPI